MSCIASRTKAYADLAQAVHKHCHTSVIGADNAELLSRMVYNVMVSNDDDHLHVVACQSLRDDF